MSGRGRSHWLKAVVRAAEARVQAPEQAVIAAVPRLPLPVSVRGVHGSHIEVPQEAPLLQKGLYWADGGVRDASIGQGEGQARPREEQG